MLLHANMVRKSTPKLTKPLMQQLLSSLYMQSSKYLFNAHQKKKQCALSATNGH